VLRGKHTDKVVERGHDIISTFGIGAALDEAQWRAVLRQMATLRLIAIDHDHWNVLRLTEASREVLTGARRLTLRLAVSARPADRRRRKTNGAQPTAAIASSPQEEGLFQALREWRRNVAREHAVPAYTVLHDSSLREIAERLPDSTALLGQVAGIGAAKLERYGDAIVQLVRSAKSTAMA
jgi:ATP-dependent DNA helicase RecQ